MELFYSQELAAHAQDLLPSHIPNLNNPRKYECARAAIFEVRIFRGRNETCGYVIEEEKLHKLKSPSNIAPQSVIFDQN